MVGTQIDNKYHTDLIIFEFQRFFRPQPFPKHYPTWLAQENGNLPYQEVNQSILQNDFLIKSEHIFIYIESKGELYQVTGQEMKAYFDLYNIVDTLYENGEMYFFNKALEWCIVVMDHPNERQALFRLIRRDRNSMLYPTKELGEQMLVQIISSFKNKNRKQVILTRKCLRKIPSIIKQLENTIHLELSYNWIELLPKEMMILPLNVLKISANPLRELPKNFSEIGKTLQELHLSGVKLSDFNWEFLSYLENLQKLYIPFNGLTAIPSEILQLKKLRVLDVSFNYIKDFSVLSNCLNLEEFYTLGNSLS
jgi:Leucine-rich repeat (LRR) protein